MAKELEKLKLLEDETVKQIVFDALHKRRKRYSQADNSGTHADYKEMYQELKNDYERQIENKSINN